MYETVPEYSVTEISSKLKSLIEQNFAYVKVRGEISGMKIATSGHAYFSLKDQDSVLACICWKYALARLKFKPEDGVQVIAFGKITIYPGQSKYQLTIESLEADGVGALIMMLEKRKAMFQAEGLFDAERKKKLPFLPKKIGVVTSLSGAVIKDILHRVQDRCPINIVIWPVLVQGDGAPEDIAKAINGFNRMDNPPDLLIVARGGGSIEDLWAFNEEIVVRAASESKIPLISAIGHETDFTLLDFVADVRAPTPTAAAEIALPVLADLKLSLIEYVARLSQIMRRNLDIMSTKLSMRYSQLPNLYDIIMMRVQKFDHLIDRIDAAFNLYLAKKTHLLTHMQLESRYLRIKHKIDIYATKLVQLQEYSNLALKRLIDNKIVQLASMSDLISSLDYKRVLGRGFAVVRNRDGVILTKGNEISGEFLLEMSDGIVTAVKKQ